MRLVCLVLVALSIGLTPDSRLVASSPKAGIYNFSLVVVTQSAVPHIEAS